MGQKIDGGSSEPWMWMLKWRVNWQAKWVSSEVGRHGVSRFSQFALDLGGSYLVGRNRSCTALHQSKDRESNGKPARVSGDKLVEFIKLYMVSLANCFPGNGTRNACWRFLFPIRIDILQAHKITTVALHLGVFQGIIFFPQGSTMVKSIVNWVINVLA